MQEEDTVETMGATEAPSEPTKEEIEEVKPLLELYQWLHAECYKPVWTVADPLGWNMDTLAVKHENGFIFARHDRPGWGLLMMLYSPTLITICNRSGLPIRILSMRSGRL
jgi:hypothetical protein